MSKNDDIIFEQRGLAGLVTLNKPDTLNAVTDAMLTALNQQLDVWETQASIDRVIIQAVPGRAFSAGGDIRHLYDCGMAGDFDFDFFAREYRLNARIAKFPKPYIAMIDGIAMGGGVGVSFHGSHRIAGEGMSFAMPEVGIGFFPDIGASYFLSRLPEKTGLYLGLTGERVNASDALWCGLATHGCSSDGWARCLENLCSEPDLEVALADYNKTPVQSTDAVAASPGGVLGPVQQAAGWIDLHFAHDSVAAIMASLQSVAKGDGDEAAWAGRTLKTLGQKSPTSLEIAFKQIRSGAQLDIDGCMQMEYRILRRILTGTEFYEGIRAAIIDKDRNPNWQPARLDEIDAAAIESHFADLGEQELKLP